MIYHSPCRFQAELTLSVSDSIAGCLGMCLQRVLRQSSSALCYSSSSAVLPLRTLTLTVMSLRRKYISRWLRVPPTLNRCVSIKLIIEACARV